MKIKRTIFTAILIVLLLEVGLFVSFQVGAFSDIPHPQPGTTTTAAVQTVDSQFIAQGAITAADQATLHFQTGGELVSLPVKVGDTVTQGQVIAQLDTYALEKQLQIAADTLETDKNNNDQNLQYQQAKVLEGETRFNLDYYNKNGYSAVPETDVIYQTVLRMVDDSELAQDQGQLNVDLSNYAISLATLTSPMNGIVESEDVNTTGINVTPSTSFIVEDPSSAVFRAYIPATDIGFIQDGNTATIVLDGLSNKIQGTVTKIYPQKTTSTDGEDVYQVDITAPNLMSEGKLDQAGSVIISTNAQNNVILVPAWTVQGGKYIWVNNTGTPELRTVTVGQIVGNNIEITSGLKSTDRIITSPESITDKLYQLL